MKKVLVVVIFSPISLTITSCMMLEAPRKPDPPKVQLFDALAEPWCAALEADEALLSDIGAELADVQAAYEDTGLLDTEIARGSSRTVRDYLELVLPVLSQDSTNMVTRERWGDDGYESVVGADCKFFTGIRDLEKIRSTPGDS